MLIVTKFIAFCFISTSIFKIDEFFYRLYFLNNNLNIFDTFDGDFQYPRGTLQQLKNKHCNWNNNYSSDWLKKLDFSWNSRFRCSFSSSSSCLLLWASSSRASDSPVKNCFFLSTSERPFSYQSQWFHNQLLISL